MHGRSCGLLLLRGALPSVCDTGSAGNHAVRGCSPHSGPIQETATRVSVQWISLWKKAAARGGGCLSLFAGVLPWARMRSGDHKLRCHWTAAQQIGFAVLAEQKRKESRV